MTDAVQTTGMLGARYLEVRLLLENNVLSNRRNIAWERFTRNFRFGNVAE